MSEEATTFEVHAADGTIIDGLHLNGTPPVWRARCRTCPAPHAWAIYVSTQAEATAIAEVHAVHVHAGSISGAQQSYGQRLSDAVRHYATARQSLVELLGWDR